MTPPMVYTTEVLKRRGAQAAQVDKPSMDLDIESCVAWSRWTESMTVAPLLPLDRAA